MRRVAPEVPIVVWEMTAVTVKAVTRKQPRRKSIRRRRQARRRVRLVSRLLVSNRKESVQSVEDSMVESASELITRNFSRATTTSRATAVTRATLATTRTKTEIVTIAVRKVILQPTVGVKIRTRKEANAVKLR